MLRAYVNRHFWWGKLLGAGLGFLTAGPVGALFGLFAGNFFDRGLNEHLAKAHNVYQTEKRPVIKKAFLQATFSSLGHMAKADSRVSEKEIQLANVMMQELRLNKNEQTAAKRFFQQGKQANFCITDPLKLLQNLARDNPKLLHTFIQLQYRMAQADGLSSTKVTTLNILLNELGLAPLHQQAHARKTYRSENPEFNQHTAWRAHQKSEQARHAEQEYYYTSQNFYASHTLDASYNLLKLSSTATQQDVKRAYRRLISKHHPDKCIATGQSEHQIKAANEKTQTIRKAYEHICEVKGW